MNDGFDCAKINENLAKDSDNDGRVLSRKSLWEWKNATNDIFEAESHRAKHCKDKRNDSDMDKNLRGEVIKLFEKWNKKVQLGLAQVYRAAIEVMKNEPYKRSQKLQKLKLSDRWCRDLMYQHGHYITAQKNYQVKISETDLDLCRSEISLKLSILKIPVSNVLNFYES